MTYYTVLILNSFENENFIVVNKPAGLLVHATDTAKDEVTLVDWLLTKVKGLTGIGAVERPGIIHRLDQDTSGLLVVAKNNYAHEKISQMFKDRLVKKTYWAIVKGHPAKEGAIDFSVMRHPVYRNKMIHVQTSGKLSTKQASARDALTNYIVLEDFDDCSLVEAKPVTGRTHQIRVHFSGLGHPLIGDKLYGQQSKFIKRHALHAKAIEFEFEGKKYHLEAEVPKDFQRALKELKSEK